MKSRPVLLSILACLGLGWGTVCAQEFAPNVLIPQSRIYGYTPLQQAVVKITSVDCTIGIVEASATTQLDIYLQNTTNSRQEAELILPVPDDAVISHFAYDGTSDLITAQVLPKAEAVSIYNGLVAQIRDPALCEFIGYQLIRTSVFPVEANAQQHIQVIFEHVLSTEGNRIDYSLTRTESLQYQVPWKIKVQIQSASPIATVYSPTHRVYVSRISDTHMSAMTDPDSEYTPGPFQMSYLQEQDGVTASLLAYPGENMDSGYFLLLAGLGSTPSDTRETILREVTVVIDQSGSMAGRKVEQAKDAAIQVISALEPDEAFNVITYNSQVQWFSPDPVIKDLDTLLAAEQYIRNISASGGTNLYSALDLALAQTPVTDMLPIVLFLTDGQPTSGITSESAIRDLVTTANPFDRRVYSFGVGYQVNAPLLDALSSLSRAQSVFVLPDQDVEQAVTDVFAGLASPVFSDPNLEICNAHGSPAIGRTLDVLPVLLPDLYEGDRLVLMGRYVGTDPLTFKFNGNYLGQDQTFSYTLGFDRADIKNGFVPRLWASRKIAQLIDQIVQLGADPGVTEDDPQIQELTETIVFLSAQFGIITEYTAFLAREGTNLSDYADLLGQASSNLIDSAVGERTGEGGVSQAVNNAQQRAQDVLNRDSSYLNSSMERTRIVNAQQANDITLYFNDGKWIDSRLMSLEDITPHQVIEYASEAFFDLALEMALDNRQGALAFAQDMLIFKEGQVILINVPEDLEEDYAPLDPGALDGVDPGDAGNDDRGYGYSAGR
jgi:Ca-activated chloride channel family protein